MTAVVHYCNPALFRAAVLSRLGLVSYLIPRLVPPRGVWIVVLMVELILELTLFICRLGGVLWFRSRVVFHADAIPAQMNDERKPFRNGGPG